VIRDGSFTQAVPVIRDGKLTKEQYPGISQGEINILASLAADPDAQDLAFWMKIMGSR